MANRKSLFSISHDHFHGLMVAQIIKKGSSASQDLLKDVDDKVRYTIHFYDQELVNHFYIEEQVLQPLVRGISKEIDEIFDKILEEHKTIGELINSLKVEVDLEKKLDKIATDLENHIKCEERILFPKIQEALSEQELESLGKKLKKNGYENIYRY